MLLLVLACAIIRRSNIVMILRTPHRRAQITFPLLAQSGHAEISHSIPFLMAIDESFDIGLDTRLADEVIE
jgi:hypothetical protein